MCGTTVQETPRNTNSSPGCSCCGPAQHSEVNIQTTTPAATESEYLVNGMTCGGCASGVSREIGRLDGVGDVQVSLVPGGTSKITVRSTGPLSPEAVRAAVANAGYELAGSK
ncbi:heavy-metal-associated domain-containing protein [Crystallibacter degradans]|uniref:heavy-metal-associated domain-containing protein n=1 Tax=Crystallibacter degradans TaxID=2726743 RepID=UPI001472E5F9|nr:heavy metal-associated domain-containing protein [Arthrobacter sp. SF27]NMR32295.1 heavy-metal-associated domain-containing protein [Arthrobacter sp. SF27]